MKRSVPTLLPVADFTITRSLTSSFAGSENKICVNFGRFIFVSKTNLLFAVDVLAMLAVLGVGDVLRVRSGVTYDLVLVFMGVSGLDGVERVEGSRVKL